MRECLLQAAIGRLGIDHYRRIQGDAAAGDLVVCLAVDAGAIEPTLQAGYIIHRMIVDPSQKVIDLDAGEFARTGRQNALGFEAAGGFAPPDPSSGC